LFGRVAPAQAQVRSKTGLSGQSHRLNPSGSMCGRHFSCRGVKLDTDHIIRMTRSLVHRGPDEEGYVLNASTPTMWAPNGGAATSTHVRGASIGTISAPPRPPITTRRGSMRSIGRRTRDRNLGPRLVGAVFPEITKALLARLSCNLAAITITATSASSPRLIANLSIERRPGGFLRSKDKKRTQCVEHRISDRHCRHDRSWSYARNSPSSKYNVACARPRCSCR
jgi:hypothetical protein